MSYKNLNTSDDNLNRLFTSASDFQNMSQNLLRAETFEAFQVWYEKLEKVDRRMLFFFLRKNYSSIKPEFIGYAEKRLKKKIRED